MGNKADIKYPSASITAFILQKKKQPGAAVIIAPGGGHKISGSAHEGYQPHNGL